MFGRLYESRFFGAFAIALVYPCLVMAVSEPKYSVEQRAEDYEIRSYEATIVAETFVESSFEDAGNKGFRLLADYIFGNNTAKSKIAMTAPVSQQPSSEKIAMTAPVSQTKEQNGHLIQFTMPENYTMETIPEPNNPQVRLRLLSPRRIAVYTYSGTWSENRFQEKLSEFKAALQRDNVRTMGEPIFARFNSPYQLWFLRRNEIWLEVVR